MEKELILDEVTTLAEKLREQALEGRQASLELSERVSFLQLFEILTIIIAQLCTKSSQKHHKKNDGCDFRTVHVPGHSHKTLSRIGATIINL